MFDEVKLSEYSMLVNIQRAILISLKIALFNFETSNKT